MWIGEISDEFLPLISLRWGLVASDFPKNLPFCRGSEMEGSNILNFDLLLLAVLNFQNRCRQREINPVKIPATSRFIPPFYLLG